MPTSSSIIWTGVSVIALILSIGAMVWFYAAWHRTATTYETPDSDPLIGETITPSQRATVKYFLVVSLLFLLQIVMGIITAHYGVEGGGFYGFPLADYLPYVVTRTWHVTGSWIDTACWRPDSYRTVHCGEQSISGWCPSMRCTARSRLGYGGQVMSECTAAGRSCLVRASGL